MTLQTAITAFFVFAGAFAVGVIIHSALNLWRYYRAARKDEDNAEA